MSDYTYDIFISFSHEDGEWGNGLTSLLENLSHPCLDRKLNIFLDKNNLRAGPSWMDQLDEAVLDSACLLSVLSSNYVKSPYCNREWMVMDAEDPNAKLGRIIPVRIDGEELPNKYTFRQSLDFSQSPIHSLVFFDSFPKLIAAINAVMETVHREKTQAEEEPAELSPEEQFQALFQLSKTYVENRYNVTTIPGMSRSLPLKGIFVNVNILQEIESERLENKRVVEEAFRQARSGFGPREGTVDGFDAVKRDRKVIVLGKPGSGKTTFLKRIALWTFEKEGDQKRIPVLISLNECFLKEITLRDFLIERLREYGFGGNEDVVETLLTRGAFLLLLDGFDEVTVNQKTAARDIHAFTDRYENNQFVISCRTVSWNYTFEQFVKVEIADFNDEQINDFVSKWFGARSETYERCAQFLKSSDRVRELVSTPLLLAMVCRVFEQPNFTPDRRTILYEEALNLLLREWDDSRFIERKPVYQQLGERSKTRLLGKLAFDAFLKDELLIERARLERSIVEWFRDVENAHSDFCQDDAVGVLEAIEAQHGLLMQRAKNLFSFSHLTFQEYFTANHIAGQKDGKALDAILDDGLFEPRWREVVLLSLEMMDNADAFLRAMRRRISRLADENVVHLFQNIETVVKADSPLPLAFCKLMACIAVTGNERIRDLVWKIAENLDLNLEPMLEIDFSKVRNLTDESKERLERYLQGVDLLLEGMKTECEIAEETRQKLRYGLLMEPYDERIQPVEWEKLHTISVIPTSTVGPEKIEEITIDLPGLPSEAKPLQLILIKAGTFDMGSQEDEKGHYDDESPQHPVTIKKDFYFGKYPITQVQWETVMGENPSYFKGNPNYPVEIVSWDRCQEFIQKLNQTGNGHFRLPTEAEWEYSCRAGITTRFYWGDDPDDEEIWNNAWYRLNSHGRTHEVGKKRANPWGLYDMNGNVWEWCEDDRHDDYKGAPKDGSAWIDSPRGASRVVRGGSWDNNPRNCRSACRVLNTPAYWSSLLGFRVVQSRTP